MPKKPEDNRKELDQKNKLPNNPEQDRKKQVPGYDEKPSPGLPPQTHQPK